MANEPLTPEQLQQVYEYFVSHGTDFDPDLDLATIDQSEWDKIIIIAQKQTDSVDPVAGHVTLKTVMDVYGGDVVQLKADVIAAIQAQQTTSVNAVQSQQAASVGAVQSQQSTSVGAVQTAQQVALDAINPKVTAAEDAAASCANSETKVNTALAEVQRIYQDMGSGEIFGLDYNMATSSGVRTGAAAGLSFHKYIGNSGSVQLESDFHRIGIWGNIFQVLRTVEGNKLVARTGDANFEEALRSGQYNLFTHIPKYWLRIETPVIDGQQHWIINVSARQFAGSFSLIRKDYIEIASVLASLKDGKHVSAPGIVPRVNTQGYTFESQAEAQGLHNCGWRDRLALIILSWVETASLNSQASIGMGVVSVPYSSSDTYKCKEATSGGHTVVVEDKGWRVGMNVSIGSAYYNDSVRRGNILKIDNHSNGSWKILTIDGDVFSTTTDTWCCAHAQPVTADAILEMGTHAGWYKTGSDWGESISHAFLYGVCDPWGNVFQVTSGCAKYADKLYLSEGRELFTRESSLPQPGWVAVDDFPWLGEGYPSAWRLFQTHHNISLVPTALGGNTSKLFGDYMWGAADAIRVPWLGGDFFNGSIAGAWCFDWFTASSSHFYYGGRFVFEE